MKKITSLFLSSALVLALISACLFFTVSAKNQYYACSQVNNDGGFNMRNDCGFRLGITFSTASQPLVINKLGRWCWEGNSGTHTVSVLDSADLSVVCSADVDLSGAQAGSFVYADLAQPVILRAEYTYYLVSMEEYNGDSWIDGFAYFQSEHMADFTFMHQIYILPDGTCAVNDVGLGRGFIGLSFGYTDPEGKTPTANTPAFSGVTLSTANYPNGLRNDVGFFIGSIITVGDEDITVTDLGRMCWEGNSQIHTLYIAKYSTNRIIAAAKLDMNGKPNGEYAYSALEKSVTLKAGKSYYLMSGEHYNGDVFPDACSVTPATDRLAVTGWAFILPDSATYTGDNCGVNVGFAGLNLKFVDNSSSDSPETGSKTLTVLAVSAFIGIGAVVISRKKHH